MNAFILHFHKRYKRMQTPNERRRKQEWGQDGGHNFQINFEVNPCAVRKNFPKVVNKLPANLGSILEFPRAWPFPHAGRVREHVMIGVVTLLNYSWGGHLRWTKCSSKWRRRRRRRKRRRWWRRRQRRNGFHGNRLREKKQCLGLSAHPARVAMFNEWLWWRPRCSFFVCWS